MGPVHGAIINWFAHKYGYVNFQTSNTSRNLMPLDVFMLGEGYHNDHHKFPSSINFGVKWYEIDPVYPVIRVLSWVGIVKLREGALKKVAAEF
jgi:stearoyl-CoA desaturase (delta-9 desaturase)